MSIIWDEVIKIGFYEVEASEGAAVHFKRSFNVVISSCKLPIISL